MKRNDEDKQVLEAASAIKRYCRERKEICGDCVFKREPTYLLRPMCSLIDEVPEDWKIKRRAMNYGKEKDK